MLFDFEINAATFLIAPHLVFGHYFLVCSILFSLFYGWKRRAWWFRKIQSRFPTTADLRREIGYSLLTSVIFAGMTLLWLGTPLRAYTKFYTEVNAHGWPY
ncbi:MAG: hypothetical protein LH618_18795, partial [Saprospiraceae bacterium]|nr:hypothetical protein [Saprospiraceae bacterium]